MSSTYGWHCLLPHSGQRCCLHDAEKCSGHTRSIGRTFSGHGWPNHTYTDQSFVSFQLSHASPSLLPHHPFKTPNTPLHTWVLQLHFCFRNILRHTSDSTLSFIFPWAPFLLWKKDRKQNFCTARSSYFPSDVKEAWNSPLHANNK